MVPAVSSLRRSLLGLLCAAVGGLSTACAVAQQGVRRTAGLDPFTKGQPAALQKAGYTSLGPFPFGHGHGSADIEALLGDEAIAWIETAHFRIGCAVAPLALRGAREWTDRTRKELAELKRRLPAVDAATRDLDPGLRAHLVALRCEALYAEVKANLGVADAAFPAEPGGDPKDPVKFMGRGPHLGMAQKFGVLIVRKGSSLSRYTRRYMGGRESGEPMRHYDEGAAMTFAVAEESTDGLLRDDLAMHTQLAYNLAFQLYSGYRHYGHDLPPWLSLGLAHWHARRISPRFSAYERQVGAEREVRDFWKWDERVVGLLRNDALEPLATLLARDEPTAFGMEQHIQAWAFVDWLMRSRKDALRVFLHEFKAPFHQLRRLPSKTELEERGEACLRRAFGADAASLEAAFRTEMLRGRK